MDSVQALADLTEISNQITAAVIFDEAGTVEAATLDLPGEPEAFVRRARDLLAAADQVRVRLGERNVTQINVSLRGGSVFAVRGDRRAVAATTTEDPTVGLVLYDLRSCLRSIDEPAGETDEAA